MVHNVKHLIPRTLRELLGQAVASFHWWRARWALGARSWWPPVPRLRRERWAIRMLADLDGPLGTEELRWLYQRVCGIGAAGRIVELNPGAGQATCALALGCWGSSCRVYAVWPESVAHLGSPEAVAFCTWHRNILRKHLLPYVTPVLIGAGEALPALPAAAGLVFVGSDPEYRLVELEEGAVTDVITALGGKGAQVVTWAQMAGLFARLGLSGRPAAGRLVCGYDRPE